MAEFIVGGMKVIFEEKDIPMLKEALSCLRLQVRLRKKRDVNSEESEVPNDKA